MTCLSFPFPKGTLTLLRKQETYTEHTLYSSSICPVQRSESLPSCNNIYIIIGSLLSLGPI